MRNSPSETFAVKPIRHLGWILPLGILAVVAWGSARAGLPLHDLLRDSTSVSNVPLHVGLVSYLGVLAWGVGAVVATLAAMVLWRSEPDVAMARMFLAVGCLTALLMLDDLFLFHETIFPRYLGLAEKATLGSYGLAAGAILVRWRRLFLGFEPAFLLLALSCLGLSLVVDLFQHSLETVMGSWRILLEDGSKFVGISCWSAYFTSWSVHVLRARIASAVRTPSDASRPPLRIAA